MSGRAAPGAAPRVAFQGELGAYSEEAVRRFFPDSSPEPRREFREVARSVAGGETEFGLLPIENSVAGSVVATYDLLADGDLAVVGEVIVPIHHCVLGTPGASLEGIRRILSHPVALAQCTRFLAARPEIEAVAAYDTAGAAKLVAEAADPGTAAIAGEAAAARYGLALLARNVEDRPDNQTRFLVVAARGAEPPADGSGDGGRARKTALMVETDNSPGALVRVLLPFASRNINLSKLESRPGSEPWTYRFFMELEVDSRATDAADALEEVRRRARSMRVLGSYPQWLRPE